MALAAFGNHTIIAPIPYMDKVDTFPYTILDDVGAI